MYNIEIIFTLSSFLFPLYLSNSFFIYFFFFFPIKLCFPTVNSFPHILRTFNPHILRTFNNV